ncbi:HAD family hydrolase [Clostridium facile]|uniref:HAD family phosphatase n=1 Tax=Clostridium facile TaxID=2763035 RepID=A0ABR7IRZ3_9CLOT|nr:HAD family phosphatase [Clostridium facile]MBC5787914.1 HAD family phosphatase [Clostridium facile]
METKLIIFDMDGVLADTEPLHRNSKYKILERFGVHEKPDLSWTVGIPNKEIWERLMSQYGFQSDAATCEQMQYDGILEEMAEIHLPPSQGLIPLLDWMDEQKIPAAIASSSNRYFVDRVTEFLGIKHRFRWIVCGDEVARKKPDPDAYQKVLQLAGITPNQAIAIEDSHSGSKAAFRAGIPCIGYQNPTSGEQDLSCCTTLIQHLEQVKDLIP